MPTLIGAFVSIAGAEVVEALLSYTLCKLDPAPQ